jgi:hypothetical protein
MGKWLQRVRDLLLRLLAAADLACGKGRTEIFMIAAMKLDSRAIFLIAMATAAIVLFCALATSTIVNWGPDASGLPADIAAIQFSR